MTKQRDEPMFETPTKEETPEEEKTLDSTPPAAVLSERRKALFEPLEPMDIHSKKRPSNESLLPPPDFDTTAYPKGWLIGKKRKLVNVDVVESMRRIAIQEMNRKVLFKKTHTRKRALKCYLMKCNLEFSSMRRA